MKYICVYCASSQPQDESLLGVTEALGKTIAEAGYGLVYGGASVGLMGVLASNVMKHGGPVCGIIPHLLGKRELNELPLTEMHKVDTMAERKRMMMDKACAFIALPGGIGTMDELCECLSLSSLGVHRKPVVLYNANGYYDKLLEFFDGAVKMGFMTSEFRASLLVINNPEELLAAIESYTPPELPSWVDLEAIKRCY